MCKKFMNDPMEIYVDDETKLTLHGLVQHYIKLSEAEKNRPQRPAGRADVQPGGHLRQIRAALRCSTSSSPSATSPPSASTRWHAGGAPEALQVLQGGPQAHPRRHRPRRARHRHRTRQHRHQLRHARRRRHLPPPRGPRRRRFGTKGLAITFLASDEDTARASTPCTSDSRWRSRNSPNRSTPPPTCPRDAMERRRRRRPRQGRRAGAAWTLTTAAVATTLARGSRRGRTGLRLRRPSRAETRPVVNRTPLNRKRTFSRAVAMPTWASVE